MENEELNYPSNIANRLFFYVGIKEFAVCSDGQRFSNPKFLRQYEKQLAFWQRRMSRRKKGGSIVSIKLA
jgi:transposase